MGGGGGGLQWVPRSIRSNNETNQQLGERERARKNSEFFYTQPSMAIATDLSPSQRSPTCPAHGRTTPPAGSHAIGLWRCRGVGILETITWFSKTEDVDKIRFELYQFGTLDLKPAVSVRLHTWPCF